LFQSGLCLPKGLNRLAGVRKPSLEGAAPKALPPKPRDIY
jgi:hypothetical protein